MSEDMNRLPGSSYQYLANSPSRSKFTVLKGYLSSAASAAAGYSTASPPGSRGASNQNLLHPDSERQGWKSWAGEKARKLGSASGWRNPGGSSEPSDNIEVITLFPGWAARRYGKQVPGDERTPRPFEVEVFTSGYVISHKNRDTISRSQKAFIRVAKGKLSLDRLNQPSLTTPDPAPLSHSTEELLSQIHLPPRPEEIKEGFDMDSLDRQFRRAKLNSTDSGASTPGADSDASSISSSAASSTNDLVSALKNAEDRTSAMTTPSTPLGAVADTTAETLRRMHANLEARLQPFWSSVLANRTVRLHLFVSPHQEHGAHSEADSQPRPLVSVDVTTASDGSFQSKFIVKWDELCHHPLALHIAFGEEVEEHTLVVVAELLKPQPLYATSGEGSGYAQYQNPRNRQVNQAVETTKCQIQIPITHCPIRVISDIDDTVKDSGILNGARAVFHNVFVKDLGDCVVSGMGEWYTDMWKKGIRFHYVSNGPFEYLSVLNEFFPLSQLPPGSIKLRSFAGRSLFNGFFSAPAARKRSGVEDILKAFPHSQFFLIGDSGEQDMELYAELSQTYANNVLAVFIRDVTTIEGVTDPLEDPTGWNAVAIQATIQPDDPNIGRRYPITAASVERWETSPASGPQANWRDDPTTHSPSPSPGGRLQRPQGSTWSKRSVTDILVDVRKRSSNSLSSFLSYRGPERRDGGSDDPAAPFTPTGAGEGPLSAEPESYVPDDGPTPRLGYAPVMENSQTVMANLNCEPQLLAPRSDPSIGNSGCGGALNSTQLRPIITQPPKPTPPPSLHQTPSSSNPNSPHYYHQHNPRGERQKSRSQQTGESSSASEGDAASANNGSSKLSLASEMMLPTSGVSLEERRRNELQMRVWRARTIMPGHVKLRVFRKPEECVEAAEILENSVRASS